VYFRRKSATERSSGKGGDDQTFSTELRRIVQSSDGSVSPAAAPQMVTSLYGVLSTGDEGYKLPESTPSPMAPDHGRIDSFDLAALDFASDTDVFGMLEGISSESYDLCMFPPTQMMGSAYNGNVGQLSGMLRWDAAAATSSSAPSLRFGSN
jgi:hypothetical protein